MLNYIIKRLLSIIPTLLLLSVLIFIGMEIAPGDAASFLVNPDMSPGAVEALRASLGLDRPPWIRYLYWLKETVQGNLGYSMIDGTPIVSMIARRLPATVELMCAALLISTILGTAFGVVTALRQYSFVDHLLTVIGMFGISIPGFFAGLLGIYVFSLNLGLLPVGGRITPEHTSFISRLPHLLLPSFVLGLSLTAGLMRYARSAMLSVLNKPYMTTARSKGISERRVNLMHGFRTALVPIAVLLGFRLPMLVGGSVIVESVFAWPGLGTLLIWGVRSRDYTVVMAVALLSALVTLIASIVVDIVVALLDPRVRLE